MYCKKPGQETHSAGMKLQKEFRKAEGTLLRQITSNVAVGNAFPPQVIVLFWEIAPLKSSLSTMWKEHRDVGAAKRLADLDGAY